MITVVTFYIAQCPISRQNRRLKKQHEKKRREEERKRRDEVKKTLALVTRTQGGPQ